MRKRKFLSVLLAASMLASLLAGGVQAAADNVHTISPNRLNYNRTLTDVDGNSVNVTANGGRSKLLVFTSSDSADGKSKFLKSCNSLFASCSNSFVKQIFG